MFHDLSATLEADGTKIAEITPSTTETEVEELLRDLNLVKDGFQNALPQLIFEKVFAYLSPGYLWIFGRPVCKGWKILIEYTIARLMFEKSLIQFIMYRNYDGPNTFIHDQNYRVHSAIYRCTKYTPATDGTLDGVFTFTPLKRCKPYQVIGQINQPTDGDGLPGWRIMDIISSLFPARWRTEPPAEYYRDVSHQPMATIQLYSPLTLREKPMTQTDIDAFHALPSVPKAKRSRPAESFTSSQIATYTFANPEAHLDIVWGKYTLSCRYLTKLALVPGRHPSDRNWDEDRTLVIDQVTVSLPDLLNWRCGNHPSRSCPVENLLVRPRDQWADKTRAPRGCVFPIDHNDYRHAFPYFPCADRCRWKSSVASFGEPAIAAFIPDGLQKWNIKGPRSKILPCNGCIAGIQDGTFAKEGRPLIVSAAAQNCNQKLCRRCCVDKVCKRHGKGGQ